ncbi:carboxypeptidase-like regulatory domain-containing protein [Fibrobacterota bacterium]
MFRLFHIFLILIGVPFYLLVPGAFAQNITISGRVINSSGEAVPGASVELETSGLNTTTGSDGSFELISITAIYNHQAFPNALGAAIHNGLMSIRVMEKSAVTITTFSLQGKELSTIRQVLDAGTHSIALLGDEAGINFYRVTSGKSEILLKGSSIGGFSPGSSLLSSPDALAKQAVAAQSFDDVLLVTADGYLDFQLELTNPEASGLEIVMTEEVELELFSFFVTSLSAMRELSDSQDGFGGDLRYGETGAGSGLRGADKICETIAEMSMPGSSAKGWRAFLSISEDENGDQVDAIDRIGEGPWYDRLGRILSETKDQLLNDRPEGADRAIINDLPNEDGIPNHDPDGRGEVDNHHFLTGSDRNGEFYGSSSTCEDWTTTSRDAGRPRIGFSWPAGNRVNWISGQDEGGCGAGVNTAETGGSDPSNPIVGSGGGYGGIYCFALIP